ncbi:MAG: competence protein ComK [Bacilli bacterium]
MKENYEINNETLAILPLNAKTSKVIEVNNEYIINRSSYQIMEASCKYFGSSMSGRIEGANELIGSKYKAPILIDDSREIIFIPTEAITNVNCHWISLKYISDFTSLDKKTNVVFKNGKMLDVDISKGSFENQIYRASKLGYIIKSRQKE